MLLKGKTFTLKQVHTFIKDHGAVIYVFGEDDTNVAKTIIQRAIYALSMSFVPSPSLCSSHIYILSHIICHSLSFHTLHIFTLIAA